MGIRRARPEQELQRTVVEHLAWRARPGTWWTHVPMGGWRTRVEAGIFKAMGARRGTPDLLLAYRGRTFALELKSDRGRLTAEQRACHEDLELAGVRVATARGLDEALTQLAEWGLLRTHQKETPAGGCPARVYNREEDPQHNDSRPARSAQDRH
jgi:hypothetical protein